MIRSQGRDIDEKGIFESREVRFKKVSQAIFSTLLVNYKYFLGVCRRPLELVRQKAVSFGIFEVHSTCMFCFDE